MKMKLTINNSGISYSDIKLNAQNTISLSLPQNMEPAPQKVPAQTLPLFHWGTGWVSLVLSIWGENKAKAEIQVTRTCNTQKKKNYPHITEASLAKTSLIPAAGTATRMQPLNLLLCTTVQHCRTESLGLWHGHKKQFISNYILKVSLVISINAVSWLQEGCVVFILFLRTDGRSFSPNLIRQN